MTRHERSFEELAPLYSEAEIEGAIVKASKVDDEYSVEFYTELLEYKKTGK